MSISSRHGAGGLSKPAAIPVESDLSL